MIGWVIETVIATTLLMLLVLAIRAPVRRAFGPTIAYALWALPLLRMLLPPLPQEIRGDSTPMLSIVPEDIIISLGHPVATLPLEPASGLGWPVWAAILWLAGAAAFIGYHLIAHSRFCARLRSKARSATTVAGGRVAMIESDAAAGPLAFGIWRKYVAFPSDFGERYDELERDLALAHELGHHARGDLIANWAALVMLALHWFNPVAWRAFRAFRADQEMACDALVLSDRHPALRHAYGRAIVKSAHGGAVSAACHLHTINEIKGRLRMLTKHSKPSRGRWLAGMAATAALTLGGLAATASGTEAADELRGEIEAHIGMPLDEISLPPIPPLPAMPAMPAMPSLPSLPAMPPMPAAGQEAVEVPEAPEAPEVPELPEAAEMPEAPPLPPVPPVTGERGTYFYRYHKDGKAFVLRKGDHADPARGEALARRLEVQLARDLPKIRSMNCGEGDPSTFVLKRGKGSEQVTIMCADRMQKFAQNTQRSALRTEMFAKRSALMSLQSARRAIEGNPDMTDDQQREALAGIDQALAELRSE